MLRLFKPALLALFLLPTTPLVAQDLSGAVRLELLPGWRKADGQHQAGLLIDLAPGWKTYWRAPGDGGIPPQLSINSEATGTTASWPTPEVFRQAGIRSVGYTSDLIVPIDVPAGKEGADLTISGALNIGVCKEVCMPATLEFSGILPGARRTSDPRISAAITDRPLTRSEAGVANITCSIRPTSSGMAVTASLQMPPVGKHEEAVLETNDPTIWVAEPVTRRQGDTLTVEAEMERFAGGAFAIDRSQIRITVLGSSHAVDIKGCPAG